MVMQRNLSVEFGSTKARASYEVLLNGVQHNLRWEPEKSMLPVLARHYRMDTLSRLYALGAHRADTALILSTFN